MTLSLLKTLVSESQHTTMLVDLTLKEIISAGKVTNPYQLFVLGHLSQFFKDGAKSADLYLEGPMSFNTNATASDLKETMQGLSDADCVKLSMYLLDCISEGECLLHNANTGVADWIRFVLRKQD